MAEEATPARAFRVFAGPHGVVRLRWTPGLVITGALAAEAMAAVDELNGALERPLLVEMAGTGSPNLAAREYFGYRCTASRIALLGASPVDRVQASFAPHRRYGRGFPVPTRFFTSERAALAWLLDDPADS